MIALRVLHNGNEVCVAGIGDLGVLTAMVTWVNSPSTNREGVSLDVGGLHSPTEEHRKWNVPDLAIGDTLTIEILDTDEITPPASAEVLDWETRASDRR